MKQVTFVSGQLTASDVATVLSGAFDQFAASSTTNAVTLTYKGNTLTIPVPSGILQPEAIAIRIAGAINLDFNFRDRFRATASGATLQIDQR